MSLTTFLPKWNRLAIAVAVVFVCFAGYSQAALISTSRSNIKHGVMATNSLKDGLTLTFNPAAMDAADKAELAKGYFIAADDIKLTAAECKELKAPVGTGILKGKYKIVKTGDTMGCRVNNTSGVNVPGANVK